MEAFHFWSFTGISVMSELCQHNYFAMICQCLWHVNRWADFYVSGAAVSLAYINIPCVMWLFFLILVCLWWQIFKIFFLNTVLLGNEVSYKPVFSNFLFHYVFIINSLSKYPVISFPVPNVLAAKNKHLTYAAILLRVESPILSSYRWPSAGAVSQVYHKTHSWTFSDAPVVELTQYCLALG